MNERREWTQYLAWFTKIRYHTRETEIFESLTIKGARWTNVAQARIPRVERRVLLFSLVASSVRVRLPLPFLSRACALVVLLSSPVLLFSCCILFPLPLVYSYLCLQFFLLNKLSTWLARSR